MDARFAAVETVSHMACFVLLVSTPTFASSYLKCGMCFFLLSPNHLPEWFILSACQWQPAAVAINHLHFIASPNGNFPIDSWPEERGERGWFVSVPWNVFCMWSDFTLDWLGESLRLGLVQNLEALSVLINFDVYSNNVCSLNWHKEV